MSFLLFLRRAEADCLAVTLYFAAASWVSPRVARAAERRLASFSDMARHLRERKFRPGADCCKTSGRGATSVRISQAVTSEREKRDSFRQGRNLRALRRPVTARSE